MHLRLLPATLVVAALAALVAASPAPAHAQLRVDPGVVIDGKVGLRVYVTLHDEEDPYVPVTDHRMLLVGPGADTTVARTDDAGVIIALVPPGDYRLTSAEEVHWRGRSYRWDSAVRVRPDMRIVDLGPDDAVRQSGSAAGARASSVSPATYRRAP